MPMQQARGRELQRRQIAETLHLLVVMFNHAVNLFWGQRVRHWPALPTRKKRVPLLGFFLKPCRFFLRFQVLEG